MNAVSYIEQNLGSKVRNLSASDAVFFGSLVFIVYLALLFLNRWLMHRAVSERIPGEFSEDIGWQFAISVTGGLLTEAMLFLIGWLFVAGMAVLFNGNANARPLFGWLGLCYLPVAVFSLFSAIRLWVGVENVDYSAISGARDFEELYVIIHNCLSSGGYRILQIGSNIAYLFTAASAVEVTHRVCDVSRLKAALIVGSYLGLLFALNRFAVE
jgi:hypothetical protein